MIPFLLNHILTQCHWHQIWPTFPLTWQPTCGLGDEHLQGEMEGVHTLDNLPPCHGI